MSKLPTVDKDRFSDVDFILTPNTPAYIDTALQICAIAAKAELSSAVDNLGRALAVVLSHTEAAIRANITFMAAPIRDPAAFHRELQQALRIATLVVTVARPNPWDAPKFVRQLTESVEGLGASEAKVSYGGGHLTYDIPMRQLVDGASQLGKPVSARIQREGEESTVIVRTDDDAAKVRVQVPHDEIKGGLKVLGKTRAVYAKLKGSQDGRAQKQPRKRKVASEKTGQASTRKRATTKGN